MREPLAEMGAFFAKDLETDGAGGGSTDPDFQFLVTRNMVNQSLARRRFLALIDVFWTRKPRNLFVQSGDGFLTVINPRLNFI